MIRIRRIVCPVDFSEFSRRALERAAVLARWYEAELVALYAAPLVPVSFPLAPGVSQATLEPFDVEAMAGELRAFTAEVSATCPRLQVMVRPGAAAPVILDLARRAGGRSAGPRDPRPLGIPKARARLRRGERRAQGALPVLTVPCAVEGHPDKPVFEHVLCGVDFLETSQRAVEYAVSLAEEANGRLTLLHTIEWVPDERRPTHTTFGLNLYRQAVLTEARARLAELVPAGARDWCQIDMRVACGEPSVEILRAAAAERADLVVLGAGHQGPIDRMLFGATTPQVLRQASCPVLTVGSDCERTEHDGLDQTIQGAAGAEGRS